MGAIRDQEGQAVQAEVAGIEVCYVEDDADMRETTVAALARDGFGARGFAGSRE
jgi:hypothetical protein